MGHIDIASVEYSLSDGRVLLNDVSFRVGDGAKVALIGPNGSGKTTLIRMICGDISPDEGTVAITGGLGVMRPCGLDVMPVGQRGWLHRLNFAGTAARGGAAPLRAPKNALADAGRDSAG